LPCDVAMVESLIKTATPDLYGKLPARYKRLPRHIRPLPQALIRQGKPKLGRERMGGPIRRIVVDECLGSGTPLLAQLRQQLGSHPIEVVHLAARHPGFPASRTSSSSTSFWTDARRC
jgi:hypothetical protein